MQQDDPELQKFLEWCNRERDTMCKITVGQQWDAKQRLAVEQFITCFDQLRDRVRRPLYKPLLGTKLAFPRHWAGIVITLDKDWCTWYVFKDYVPMQDYILSVSHKTISKHGFYHWDDLLTALQGPEKENRQLHVMADLISWYLVGSTAIALNNQLNFDL